MKKKLLEKKETDQTGIVYLIKKDILSIEKGIICHQVNAQGVMGAGLAAQIKMKYPIVYRDYIDAYNKGKLELGSVIISKINDNLFVLSLVGQLNYGRGRKFTDYNALKKAFLKVKKAQEITKLDVYLPYKIGCGLGGGSWNIVKSLIERYIPNAKICKM